MPEGGWLIDFMRVSSNKLPEVVQIHAPNLTITDIHRSQTNTFYMDQCVTVTQPLHHLIIILVGIAVYMAGVCSVLGYQ